MITNSNPELEFLARQKGAPVLDAPSIAFYYWEQLMAMARILTSPSQRADVQKIDGFFKQNGLTNPETPETRYLPGYGDMKDIRSWREPAR